MRFHKANSVFPPNRYLIHFTFQYSNCCSDNAKEYYTNLALKSYNTIGLMMGSLKTNLKLTQQNQIYRLLLFQSFLLPCQNLAPTSPTMQLLQPTVNPEIWVCYPGRSWWSLEPFGLRDEEQGYRGLLSSPLSNSATPDLSNLELVVFRTQLMLPQVKSADINFVFCFFPIHEVVLFE